MNRTARHDSRPRATGRAFTLIEVLIVIVILVILVSLVVGVTRYVRDQAKREQTIATERILLNAVQAYYDNALPRDYPPDDEGIAGLYEYLTGDHGSDDLSDRPSVQAARERLDDLPEGAMADGTFWDAYDNELYYDADGAVGGSGPVIVSAGPDGRLEATAEHPDAEADNIRSDEFESQ